MNFNLYQFLFQTTVGKLLLILLSFFLFRALIRFIKFTVLSRLSDRDRRYRSQKLLDFASYLLLIAVLLGVFSKNLGSLSLTLGVAGAGIAFALQEVIASVAGWLAIMLGGFYKSGDRVQLGGIKGDVMDIGVLRTTIMETGQWVDGDLYNGRIVLVANSFVFKEPVFNYSGQFPFLWDELKIPVKYGSDYEFAKEMLLKIGRETAGDLTTTSKAKWTMLQKRFLLEDAQTEPMVSITANDNWVTFTLRYVVAYKRRRAVQTELFSKILQAVSNSNGVVQLSSATFQITEIPDLKIKKDV